MNFCIHFWRVENVYSQYFCQVPILESVFEFIPTPSLTVDYPFSDITMKAFSISGASRIDLCISSYVSWGLSVRQAAWESTLDFRLTCTAGSTNMVITLHLRNKEGLTLEFYGKLCREFV